MLYSGNISVIPVILDRKFHFDILTMGIYANLQNAFEEDNREAANAGMNRHISKSINIENMFKTLSEILG